MQSRTRSPTVMSVARSSALKACPVHPTEPVIIDSNSMLVIKERPWRHPKKRYFSVKCCLNVTLQLKPFQLRGCDPFLRGFAQLSPDFSTLAGSRQGQKARARAK